MRKFNLFAVCALLCMSFALCGCEKYHETTTIIAGPEDKTPNLTYTLWQGTLTAAGETLPVSVSFSNESGYYYLEDVYYDFDFAVYGDTVEQCAVRIKDYQLDYDSGILVAFWWVMQWTDDTLVLEAYPFDEESRMVIRLNRVR